MTTTDDSTPMASRLADTSDPKKAQRVADIGLAHRVMNERLMLPRQGDFLGQLLLGGCECWPNHIEIAWDQWAVCTIRCDHGKFRGTSDFLNLTEAVLRAVERLRGAEHPRYCMADYVATDDDGSTYTTDCTLWVGHNGDHGEREDDDA